MNTDSNLDIMEAGYVSCQMKLQNAMQFWTKQSKEFLISVKAWVQREWQQPTCNIEKMQYW